MSDTKALKKKFKLEFAKNYEKYYPVNALKELGFMRKQCPKCGSFFWTKNPEQEYCGDPQCVDGYHFIKDPPGSKRLSYKGAWDEFVKIFKEFGHTPIQRYPVVARWRDDAYFVQASIYDFQPYVVSGEVDPPANPLVVPQFSLRFNDIDNVGITGAHMTGFIMVGQHVFNKPNKFIYFKEESTFYNYEWLTRGMGIPGEEITFIEDAWVGGGNAGPNLEYFVRGLELGNEVFMQFRVTADGGLEPLKTQVIDMGTGAERYPWIANGTPTAYDVVFPKVLQKMYTATGFHPNTELMIPFSRFSGLLNVDEVLDEHKAWENVAKSLGISVSELRAEIFPLRALYSIADHTRSLLVAIHDGALPSNVGGGYNLRYLLRRSLTFIKQFEFDFTLSDVLQWHIDEFSEWYPELKEVGSLFDIIETEEKRFEQTLSSGTKMVKKLIKKGKISADTLVELYDSQGITPEFVSEVAEKEGLSIEIPSNFSALVQQRHEQRQSKVVKPHFDVDDLPETRKLYYENQDLEEADAKVIKQIDEVHVVLDQTIFYPTSGGQHHDIGWINDMRVIDVLSQAGRIIHVMENPVKFKKGQKVHLKIDVERRHILCRHHTATHIINAAAREILGPHIWQAGAEKTVEKARLDITHYKGLTYEEEQAIEKRANEIVYMNYPVEVRWEDRNEAEKKYGFRIYQGGAVPGKKLRIVDIKGIDVEACGGTHCSSTGVVGPIKILNTERIQDGVVRINFVAGSRAVELIQERDKILHDLCNLWGIKPDDLVKTAERFFTEWKKQQKEIKKIQAELIESKIISAISSSKESLILIKVPVNDAGKVSSILKSQKSNLKGKAVIVIGPNMAIGISNTDLNIKKELEKYCEVVKGNEKEAKGFKIKPGVL